MTYYAPYATIGLPGISAGATNQMVEGGRFIQEYKPSIVTLFMADHKWKVDQWIGEIYSATAISGQTNRWLYQIEKIETTTTPAVNTTNTAAHLDTSCYVSPAVSVPAYNLFEYKHAATGNLGDGTPLTSIPTGFTVAPVEGIVIVYQHIDQSGGVIFLFDRQNGLSGTCA